VFALLWLVLVLSVGAVSLLYVLLRRGAASRVASLFFLVPPTTALIAWPLFGEQLGPLELLGMALTVTGVALVNISQR
jgi:drug/metabolite transporter (DMT)-like permease